MTTPVYYGYGGGHDSQATERAKQFIVKFIKHIRTVINKVPIEIKIEHPVPCPAEFLDEPGKAYQVDIAVIFPTLVLNDFAIEIDGKVGHNHPTRDKMRDIWIYKNHNLPIYRLRLSWLKEWMRADNYLDMFEELMYCHTNFMYKLPKNALLYLAWKERSDLFP